MDYEANAVSDEVVGPRGEEARHVQEITQLKRTRAGFKPVLTRKRNELSELLEVGADIDCVKNKVSELNQAFENFKGAHELYTKSLADVGSIKEAYEYFHAEYHAVSRLKEKVAGWIVGVECANANSPGSDVLPKDSISQAGTGGRSVASSSKASSVGRRYVEESAKRRALEAKLKLFEEQQALAERKFQLQQQGKRLKIKSDLIQIAAKEQVYAEADALERGSTFELDLKSKELSPQNCTIKEREETGAAKVERMGLNHVVSGWSPSSLPPCEQGMNQSQASVEAIERMVDIQEKQAKCMEGLVKQQYKSALTLTLPKPEVPVFGRDPVEYSNFVKAFECLIESRTESGSSRLYYLVQYTEGEVQELMRSCLAMDPEEGYREARKLLKQRYGQRYKIATAYVDKVTKGPAIKSEDRKGLQNFATLLTSCRNTLKSIGYSSKIENPESLRGVINRLPYDLRKEWRNNTYN